ncbi:MAG: hypothetical protein VYE64_04440 [Planctomycetota bacterium]|nr:hypothetical protein [Planctomycetota bacterium]
MIRKVKEAFVPISLKAGKVNRPPDSNERALYEEIRRSRPLPQGICVVNPAGKVLEWVVSFDNDQEVLRFLDHALARYELFPDASQPVPAERYMHFPSRKLEDMPDDGRVLDVPAPHGPGAPCPAVAKLPVGALDARLVGRAVGPEGQLSDQVLSQDHYAEERFSVSPQVAKELAKRLDGQQGLPIELPAVLFRPFVAHAFLGVLDVAPILNPGPSKGELIRCDFSARPVKGSDHCWRITGKSEVSNGDGMSNATLGDMHHVKLDWEGFVFLQNGRVTEIVLGADGRERLKFGTERKLAKSDVSYLPSGHTIDLNSRVRYGIVAQANGETLPGSSAGRQE